MGAERRIIPIAGPIEKDFRACGSPYLLVGWTKEQWERIPEAERPGDAFPFGQLGWVAIRPDARPG